MCAAPPREVRLEEVRPDERPGRVGRPGDGHERLVLEPVVDELVPCERWRLRVALAGLDDGREGGEQLVLVLRRGWRDGEREPRRRHRARLHAETACQRGLSGTSSTVTVRPYVSAVPAPRGSSVACDGPRSTVKVRVPSTPVWHRA